MDKTDKVVTLIDECNRMGLQVEAPDVNASQYMFTVSGPKAIRYGLGAIKGVGQAAVENMLAERERGGPFRDLRDLCRRLDLNKVNRRVLEALIRAGALKVRRPVSDLVPLKGRPAPAPSFGRSRDERLETAAGSRPAAVQTAERKLDARGLRVEELLREVDRFLDRLYAEGAPDAVILHGHGTGALKQALRDHLAASPYVGAFHPGDRHDGGDAVTVVQLRR
jgi:hypothetical protein